MKKRLALLSVILAVIVATASFSVVGSGEHSLACLSWDGDGGVVDKAPCEAFTVKIIFKNTGKSEGVWAVNIAFEGDFWVWSGKPQNLTLKPSKTKTLTWNGVVPCDAPIGSVTRLIVYYNDSFVRLNWWIHIVSNAKLTITTSTVE
ncbi:MAG: hypothetical protein QXI91_03405 [Candidatus Bathyarchaeia archaeon]